MKRNFLRAAVLLIAAALLFTACGQAPATAPEEGTPAPSGPEPETEGSGSGEETEEAKPDVLPQAGLNEALTRDGTPHKYFTMSFDDGLVEDKRIIEILDKYDAHCCTFFINTGLAGLMDGERLGIPGLVSQRLTQEELESGVYDGYDVEVHTLHHTVMTGIQDDPEAIRSEVGGDADNIAALTGFRPVGMAWPGGSYDQTTARRVMANTEIGFARTVGNSLAFGLPTSFMKWEPTCWIGDGDVIRLAEEFRKAECTEDMLFYVWGHGYEVEGYDLWHTLDTLVRMMSRSDDIICLSNAEFYQLFRDEIPGWTNVRK